MLMVSRRIVFWVFVIAIFLMALIVAPAAAERTITKNGTIIYVGEESLSFADGEDFDTGGAPITKLIHFTDQTADNIIYIDGENFDLKNFDVGTITGDYYVFTSSTSKADAVGTVEIQIPSVHLDVVLNKTITDRKNSVDGKSVSREKDLIFKLDTNLNGFKGLDTAPTMNVEVTLPGGGVVTQFQNAKLNGIFTNGSTSFYTENFSLSGAQAGTYTAIAKWPKVTDFFGKGYDSNRVSFEVHTRTLVITTNKDTVISGNSFAVTIAGESKEDYILSVNGADPHNPRKYPMIAPGQTAVNYFIPGENDCNRTVKTNAGGIATVQFNTTRDTEVKTYTIGVEDTQDPGRNNVVKVKVEAGSVTIASSGTGTYYIGEEITFSGTCTDGDRVYLFMTGPNLNANGANLTHPWSAVATDNSGTFTRAAVESDDTWSCKWNTAGLSLDAGGYTVYAVSEPRGKGELSGAGYATAPIGLRNGYVTASVSSTAVTRGDRLIISGIATGSPDNVFVWIFGKNYYGAPGELNVRSASVESDGSFEVKLESPETEELAASQYFVIVQHPMGGTTAPFVLAAGQHAAGSIVWDDPTGPTPGRIWGATINPVTLTHLQAPAAATALVNALDCPNIPDTYVKLTFFVETSRIWIDGVSDQTYGEIFMVTGTTDYPAGTPLTYRLSANEDGADVLFGEVIVGDNGGWSFEVDTTMIGPGAYTLLVKAQDGQTSMVALFNVYDDVIHPVPPAGAIYRVERISVSPALDDLSPGDKVTLDGTISLRGPLPGHYGLEFSTDLPDPVWTYALQVGGQMKYPSSMTVSSRSFALSAWELDYRHDRVYVLITLSGTVPKVGKDDPTLLRILERDSDGRTIPNSEHRLSFTPAGSGQSQISGDALTLHPGWNFISIPRHLEAGNDTASIFTSIDTAGHSALRYETAGRTWISLTPADRLTPLEGIWIYSGNLTTIPLTFSTDLPLPPSERSLAQGWNAIGITGASSASARDTLLSVNRGWTTLIGFDAGEQDFEVAIINGGSGANTDGRPVYPGRGYWLYMTEPGDLCAIGV